MKFGEMTRSQVVAMVFSLFWATCPTVFGLERGKQIAKNVIRNVRPESLLDQIKSIRVPNFTVLENSIEIPRSEGKYVFNDLSFNNGVASGSISVYDINNVLVATLDLTRLTMLNNNRIDYSISMADQNQIVHNIDGIFVGGNKQKATVLSSVDGEETRSMAVDYSGLTTNGGVTVSADNVVAAAIVDDAIIIVVVVVFVLITCALFGWWGC